MERWNEAFDILPDIILLFDRNWRVDRANNQAEEHFNTTVRDNILGLTCEELLHDKIVPAHACPVCRQKVQRKPTTWTGRAESLGGRYHITVTPASEAIGGGVLIARHLVPTGSAGLSTSQKIQLKPKAKKKATLKAAAEAASAASSGEADVNDDLTAEEMISHGILEALDQTEIAAHVIDLQTFEILWANQLKQRQFGRDIVGRKCYEAIQKNTTSCQGCRNDELVRDGVIQQAISWLQRDSLSNDLCLFVNKAFLWPDGRLAKLEIVTDIFEEIPEKE